jgi:hypothetical protein
VFLSLTSSHKEIVELLGVEFRGRKQLLGAGVTWEFITLEIEFITSFARWLELLSYMKVRSFFHHLRAVYFLLPGQGRGHARYPLGKVL